MTRSFWLGALLCLMSAGFEATTALADDNAVEPNLRPKPVDPPRAQDVEDAFKRGVNFLLTDQNKNGSWGSPTRTKDLNIHTPVPDGHAAMICGVTSLSVSALIEAGGPASEVQRAIERGEDWLMENLPKLRRSSADVLYNVWAHAYGIRALVRMHARVPDDAKRREKIEGLIREQIELLGRFESVDGGWGYYDFKVGAQRPATDSTSFTTATVLVAFYEAKKIGIEPPARLIKRPIDSIVRQRKPDFSYLYGEYMKNMPMAAINRPGGSVGRSQACNLALRLWGDAKITDEVLKAWLDRIITRNGWLDMARKRPIPHESHFAVAGYFFYYGHYYAAHCIELLKPEDQTLYKDNLAHIILKLQEKDGSWWDYPLYNYHQPYGTAYALMTLKRCQKAAGD
jgi:hypothetical protein